MNTLLVVSLVVGLAQCQSSSENFEAVYREGKEYVYLYESQVLTGLPMGSKIYSGIKIKANVRIQFTSPTRVNLQIEKPCRWFKVNDRIDSADPSRNMVPTELFKEITDPDLDSMRTELFKPITFSYIRGHVDDLVTEADDPIWSVDIKKGFVAFFELNFNERQSLQSLDHPVTVEHSDLLPKFYRVVEQGVTGVCETSYWVKPDITTDGQTLMRVTKVRNYDRCIYRAFFYFDMFNGRYCDFCEPNMRFDPFTAQSSVRYNIVGSPTQFVIMNAYTESQYNFVPYSERGGRITTFTNQTLTLVDSRPSTTQIHSPTSPQKHDEAIMGQHPEEIKDGKSLSQKQIDIKERERNENFEMAVKALLAYEHFVRSRVEEEAGDVMVELRRLLRILDKPRLEKLLGMVNNSDMKNARKALLDILPVIGTFDGVDVIVDKLITEDPMINWPPSVFMSLALMPSPDVPTVQRLLEFVIQKKFTDPIHKRAAWLCLGSLGHKMANVIETEEKEYQQKQKLIEELKDKSNVKNVRRELNKKMQKLEDVRLQKIASFNTLKRRIIESVMNLMKSKNPDDILLAIKTVGNLGYIEFFPEVKAIIMKRELSPIIRMQAIFCTRRMYHNIPEMVRQVLLPVYLDYKEPEEIRMSAYLTFMNTNPPRPDMEIIARSVYNEPSYNVGALVWSNLVSLSNRTTTCHCIQSLARNTTLALRYARRFDWGLQFSNYMHWWSYNRNLKAGHAYQHALLFNSKERIPRGSALQYNTAFLGQSADMLEIGMNGRGFDSYLDELSADAGSTSLTAALAQLLKPRKPRSMKQSEQEMNDIKQKVKIEPRVRENIEGHIYFKLFGQELIFLDIAPTMKEKKGPIQQSQPRFSSRPRDFSDSRASSMLGSIFNFMNMFRSILFPLRHEMVVTETGLPVFVNLDLVGTWKIDSNFRVEATPAQGKSLNSKEMVLDFKPSGLFQLRCEMGVDWWYFRTGAMIRPNLYLNSPLLLSFNINPDKEKFIMTLKDEKTLNPFKFESTPMTFFRHFPPEASRYPQHPELKEIQIVDGVELSPFNYEYGKDWFGRTCSLTGTWPIPRLDNVPIFPMTGKWLMFTEYKPLNPTGWELQFQHVSEKGEQVNDIQSHPNKESSWWPFGGWFSDSEQMKQENQPVTSQEHGSSEEQSQERFIDEPMPSSINLKEQDLTIQHLKNKFEKFTQPVLMADKCGFVLRLVEPGTNPVHDVQITSFYQRPKPGQEEVYTVEVRRAPIPNVEKMPWKMVTDIRMTYPSTIVEPSDLLSDQYQEHIQKQIQMSVYSSEKKKETLIDLDTLTLSHAVKYLQKLTQPSGEFSTVQDIVNHIMQNEHDPDSQMLKDIIQKQRQLYRDVREFIKQPSDFKKRHQFSLKYQELLERCDQIIKKLKTRLDDTPVGQQHPEDSAMNQNAILSLQKTIKQLFKVFEKIRIILPPHEQISLQKKLLDLKDQMKSVKQKQAQHSISKQSQELDKSHMEVEPEQRTVYRFLLDFERQLIQTSQYIQQHPEDFSSVKPYLDNILKKSEAAKEALDDALIRDVKLGKMVRIKCFEIVLKHKLIAQDIEDMLSKPVQMHGTELGKELQIKLKKLSTQISKRILLAVNFEKETSLTASLPQQDQDSLKKLQMQEVKQIQILEQIKMMVKKTSENPQQYSDVVKSDTESKIQDLQKTVEAAQQIHESIKLIVEKLQSKQYPRSSPVILKALKVLSKQALISEKIRQTLMQWNIHTQTEKNQYSRLQESSPETQVYSPKLVPVLTVQKSPSVHEMNMKVEVLEKESFKLLKKINQLLSEVPSEEKMQQISNKIPIQPTGLSPGQLLQKVHKVQAKQLELESVVQSMVKALDEEVPDSSKLFKQFSDIYQLISGMAHLQKFQEEVQGYMKSAMSSSPISKKLQTVCSQLKDSLKQQKEKMVAFENKLKKYQQSSSLQLPLQKAQQLKDQIQGMYYEQKNIEQQIKNKIASSDKVQGQKHKKPYSPQPSWGGEPAEIQGVMTVYYGLEGTTMRKVLMKILGRKTLEQLLWEQQQSRLGEQDKMVKDYLEQKLETDDKLTPTYHKLKHELNMFRHWKILCAYEKEAVYIGVRSLVWRIHEYIKYRFYPKLTMVMPNASNIPNNFEIVSELRRDRRSMDMNVMTPYETSRFWNLHVPNLCRIFVSPNTEPFLSHVQKGLTQNKLPATCEINDMRIKTLDHLRYEVPKLSLSCKKILSMDCSPDSKYVIMSQPSKIDSSQKDITLLTKNEKIEIVHEVTGPKVKVNDKPIDLVSPLSVRNEDGTIVSVKKSGNKVIVSIPKLSLLLKTDGQDTTVMVHQYYFSKVCGLCGNMDSNPNNDLEGPQMTSYPDGPTMSAAYLVPDAQCDAEEIHKKLGIPEIRKQSKMIPPVQQTKVVEKHQGSVRKTCFSTLPVKRCPENTSPEGITTRLVAYHCLDSSSPLTQQLVNRSHMHILDELRYKTVDVNAYESQPKACVTQ